MFDLKEAIEIGPPVTSEPRYWVATSGGCDYAYSWEVLRSLLDRIIALEKAQDEKSPQSIPVRLQRLEQKP